MTGANGQPAPNDPRSKSPVTFRQEEVTVQVPTMLPPQGVMSAQESPAALGPEVPPVFPPPLPEPPPVPDEPFEWTLHAHGIIANVSIIVGTADWAFIRMSFRQGSICMAVT